MQIVLFGHFPTYAESGPTQFEFDDFRYYFRLFLGRVKGVLGPGGIRLHYISKLNV